MQADTKANKMINDLNIQDTNVEKILSDIIDQRINNQSIIIKSASMPLASQKHLGEMRIYSGTTDSVYTHGYIYECTSAPIYTSTVTFQPATISGITVTCSGDNFARYVSKWIHADVTQIVSGTLTYDLEGNLWILYGYDSNNTEVGHFQLYQEDYEDAGFTFSDTPENGDIVAFTCTITESGAIYGWQQINVQPSNAR